MNLSSLDVQYGSANQFQKKNITREAIERVLPGPFVMVEKV